MFIALVTAAFGAWFAFVWQSRSQRNERYYAALSERLRAMRQAAEFATPILSGRIYAIQRMILNIGDPGGFEKASADEKAASLILNDSLMQIELATRMYFVHVRRTSFEDWQGQVRELPIAARKLHLSGTTDVRHLLNRANFLRHGAYQFLEGMIQETEMLDNRIHFGIKLNFSSSDLHLWSTSDLFKAVLFPRKELNAVVRPSADFLQPLSIR